MWGVGLVGWMWGVGLVGRMWGQWGGRGASGEDEVVVRADVGIRKPQRQQYSASAGVIAGQGPSQTSRYLLVFRLSMISLNVEDGRITAEVFASSGQ